MTEVYFDDLEIRPTDLDNDDNLSNTNLIIIPHEIKKTNNQRLQELFEELKLIKRKLHESKSTK